MGLGVETPRASATGNGVTTVFPFSFTYDETSEVRPYLDDVLQTTGFTVNEEDVTYDTAPASGVSVVTLRETDLDQQEPFTDPQQTTLETVERVLDRTTRQIQDLNETLGRSVVLAPSEAGGFSSDRTMGTDASGNPILRTIQEEVDHLGITAKVEEATTAAASATTAKEAAEAAALSINEGVYHSRETLQPYNAR